MMLEFGERRRRSVQPRMESGGNGDGPGGAEGSGEESERVEDADYERSLGFNESTAQGEQSMVWKI